MPDSISPRPATDPAQQEMILAAVDKFLERDVAPYAHALEAKDEYPHEIVERMKELGLFGATIGEEWGGLGLDVSTYTKIVERVSAVWMSVSGIFNSHLIMAAAVERFGTEDQKKRYLPRFATGELRGGIALTEPDAGTDLQGIRTRAEKSGDGYVLNGTKTWISNSIQGQILAVLTKTDLKAEPAQKGMSLFLVEKGDNFRVTRKLEKLGYKGIDSGELILEDCVVSGAPLLGGGEGRGGGPQDGGLGLGRREVCARG
ncbi:MAG: acyl-CoA dehydrogenase family protein, partial [Pseudomonadota bacterium]|nr:acyl-CoA dehydrogenase family protein [Pseudomonadota bacterium]